MAVTVPCNVSMWMPLIVPSLVSAFACLLSILVSCSKEPEPNPIVPTPKATIKGVVLDVDSNEPIYNAKINTNPATKEIHTDLDGKFLLEDLPPKEYMVYSYLQGFDDDSVFVSLTDGDTANVGLYLNNFGEYLDYYPLDVGNYWIYESGNSYYSVEIISDSMISGKNYKVIEERVYPQGSFSELRYERLDLHTYLIYRYYPEFSKEFIIDSLAAKPSQSFTSNMYVYPGTTTLGNKICKSYCFGVRAEMLWEMLWEVKYLKHNCGTDQPEYHMAKGLGITSIYIWRTGSAFLKYAIIKGIEYGEKP